MSGETGRTMVIGIAGGTGSGKTTVTRKIKEYFGEDVSVIYHDSYYKRHDELPYEERVKLNYDHPDAFDTAMMAEDLRRGTVPGLRLLHLQPHRGNRGGPPHQGGHRRGNPYFPGPPSSGADGH